jgi:hypothetical protein
MLVGSKVFTEAAGDEGQRLNQEKKEEELFNGR